MNVYAVWADGDTFSHLRVDTRHCRTDEEALALEQVFWFEGERCRGWKAPRVYIDYPKRPTPDFWQIGVNAGAFAVAEETLEQAAMLLEMAGELLPLPTKEGLLSICNILECVDCVDEERSERRLREWPGKPEKNWTTIERPAFFPRAMPESTLFKIPQRPRDIYCWERDADPVGEFKAFVEANKLTGLRFRLVWCEERGIVQPGLPSRK